MNFLKNNCLEYCLILFSVSAFVYYQLDTGAHSGEFHYSSQSPAESVIRKVEQANTAVTSLGTQEDMKCACKFGDVENVIQYDTPEKCGPERNYYEKNLRAWREIDKEGFFTRSRAPSAHNNDLLPKKCTVYIMKKFFKDRALTVEEKLAADIEWNKSAPATEQREVKPIEQYRPDPHLFSVCSEASGKPERYPHKPCVTEEYVNVVHNSVLDVSDCMGLPAKFMAPKLSNESGMHPNALALGFDGGIGQFTPSAIEDVAQNFENFKASLDRTKASCRRIASIPGAIPASAKEILPSDENRCYMIDAPANPLRSLVFYGIFYKATKRHTNNAWSRKRTGLDGKDTNIEALLKQAGVDDAYKETLKEMLFVMAYNSGPGQPAVFFSEWLKYRLSKLQKHPVTKEDFNMSYWPKKEFRDLKRGRDRGAAMEKEKNGPLSLAEYLFAYKDSLYIALVRGQARQLDKVMGDSVCTEQNFLQL